MEPFKISFIIAGVQKGGTTALHRRMRANPTVGMPKGKESKFFFRDDGHTDWSSHATPALEAEYNIRPTHRLFGQATPNTLFWEPTHPRLKAYDPDLRFILIFRDPVERAFSHWKMEVFREHEKRSFGEAIRQGRKRVEKRGRFTRGYGKFSYIERGMYAHQLDVFMQSFPRRNVLLLANEDFRRTPDRVLSRISGFLNVDDDWPDVAERASLSGPDTGERMQPEDAAYLREVFAEDHARFVEMTGLGRDWLQPRP